MSLLVIGAGVGRTGTSSLKVALQRLLGGPCYHTYELFRHPEHVPIWQAAIHGEYPDWNDVFGNFVGTVDWPGAAFWAPLSEAYPDALVLLSVRESADAWFRSARATINEMLSEPAGPEFEPWHAMAHDLLRTRFAPIPFDEASAKEAYERHNAEVRATVPADRLLEWQVTDGWAPLCERLGVPVPEDPFPHLNTMDQYRAVLDSHPGLRPAGHGNGAGPKEPRDRIATAVEGIARSTRPMVKSRPRLRAVLGRARRTLPRPRPKDPVGQVIFEFARAYPRAVFVQVGANDGVYRDPLRDEIRARPWHGIMVEPVPYIFERLRAEYGRNPRLILENAAIAAEDGTRPLYHLREAGPDDPPMPDWYDKLGSLHRGVVLKHARAIPDFEDRLVAVDVRCLSFESLCRKHGITDLDLVQIDTEGHDFEIVKLIDLEALRPRIVMYEHLHFDPDTRRSCSEHLRRHGYEEVADPVNTICLRTADLDERDRSLYRLWQRLSPGARSPTAADF